VVQPGGYPLTDLTYANLLHSLTRRPTQPIPPGIKQDIQAYYANPNAPITTKQNPAQWAQVQADLAILAGMPTSTEPLPYPTYGDDAPVSAVSALRAPRTSCQIASNAVRNTQERLYSEE